MSAHPRQHSHGARAIHTLTRTRADVAWPSRVRQHRRLLELSGAMGRIATSGLKPRIGPYCGGRGRWSRDRRGVRGGLDRARTTRSRSQRALVEQTGDPRPRRLVSPGAGLAGVAFMHDDPTVADQDRNTHALEYERHRLGSPELTQVIGVSLRARGDPGRRDRDRARAGTPSSIRPASPTSRPRSRSLGPSSRSIASRRRLHARTTPDTQSTGDDRPACKQLHP